MKRLFDKLRRRPVKNVGYGWTCHVCHDYRPDALIGVYSTTRMLGKVPMQTNVRYCLDRPECVEGAKHVTFGATA